MGNPHVVIPVPSLEGVDLEGLGPLLETHPAFPARTNVHFVQVLHPGHLVMRVWERGAGVTLACGTGACATLVAVHLLGRSDRRARVDLPGGTLQITWDEESGHVLMGGPAEPVFDGVLTASLLSEADISETDTIDCATACVNGCIRPEACGSREARARVEELLQHRSLDELVDLAAQSAESRTRARLLRDAGLEG
jgi:diaminopimelate epimerase